MMTMELIPKRYYDVFNDIASFPEAIIIIAYSRRGVGKTYSVLKGCYQSGHVLTYVKRTIKDVNTILSSPGNDDDMDPSPYAPINRDLGTNIRPKRLGNGIGAFYDMNEDSETKKPIAYVVALSAVKDVKGFSMPCDFLVFDEFIPQASETRVLSTEGESLLDLYMTLSRDREKRRDPDDPFLHMRMLLFANAEDIYCPVVDELQIIDDLACLACSDNSIFYNPDRKILIHHVNEILLEESELSGIYQSMKGTRWAEKSFGGKFSKVDFSNVEKKVLKGFKPLIRLKYRNDEFYIYSKNHEYYITKQRSNRYLYSYDLNRDNDIRRFFRNHILDLEEICMDGHMKFSDYSYYDLIVHYRHRFKRVLD